MKQVVLKADQVAEFYHDQFVEDQLRDFTALLGNAPRRVVDVGGGCGFFALGLHRRTGSFVRVLDSDPASIEACRNVGVMAQLGDALAPEVNGSEEVASFNLMLHHLVASSEAATTQLQCRALSVWRDRIQAVFVNEYIYESYVAGLSGWLIYQITSSRFLSACGRMASRIIPSMRANTFGAGVRFRSHAEWIGLFESAGFKVVASTQGVPEVIAPIWRLLFIRRISRDSFWLRPVTDSRALA